ncbi:glutathione S-transferase N-terminal domain-containing protein [Billgrantia bachuensis]|uniref:glutathione S-transferase N-terminal domain-containing protein n=1 Tax=Billgrantia bachuensis TaxID=2717286 RepID=UPI001F0E8CD7|nr:glutathione S-transferase N-terminal domain-containing protein [Halomonas bachuensis]
MITLYGTPPTRALRAIWLLNELGLEYRARPVDLMQGEHQQQDFLSLHPSGKVPVLVDGDLVVTESAAIQLYLANTHRRDSSPRPWRREPRCIAGISSW